MTTEKKAKILLVDDEQQVLEALARGLRRTFDIHTATSGADGLAILAREPDIAIVMSDMRMPVMNGAAFLAQVRLVAPDSVRLLLTGQADMEDAISAINEGHIFRFLRKPCPPELMQSSLAAAAEQHRLVTAEKTLLEKTLRGSIQALCDTLALANPGVFGMATRVKRCASAVAQKLGLSDLWQLEVAAMVCQLGAVTLPAGVFERRARGEALQPSEREMLERVPVVTDQLLAPIPRLESVREIIRHGRTSFLATDPEGTVLWSRTEIPLFGRILKVALDFDALEAAGNTSASALGQMREHAHDYDPKVLAALASLHTDQAPVVEVSILALKVGMVIAADVLTKSGQLLIARGHEVTPGLVGRLRNYASSLARSTVSVETGD